MPLLMPVKRAETAKTRNILNVELTTSASRVLTETQGWTKMSNKDIIARLLNWFARQDLDVRRIAMGYIPDGPIAEETKRLAIEKMRGMSDEAGVKVEVIGGDDGASSAPPDLELHEQRARNRGGKGQDRSK